MSDLEKVIKGLECCEWSGAGRYDGYEPIYENCEKCPYNNEEDCKDECLKKLIKGALELLKELEERKNFTVADLFRQFSDDVRKVWDGRSEEVKLNDRC